MSKKPAAGKWTDEQLAAITSRGCNLLVSAAAGAGKTAVLVERIINRVKDSENPVDIDRLLVVTFTNAAAAEMRERIASAISSELSCGSDGGRLALQLALLNRARITTIHSFCTDILRQYFYRLDLDPGFRIADETESIMLKADVLEELLESRYSNEGENSGFKELAECYGEELDDTGLMQLVTRIYDFSRSDPDPDRWLERMAGRFSSFSDADGGLSLLTAEVLSEAARNLEGVLAEMEMALDLCLEPGGPGPYALTIDEEISMVRGLIESCRKGWDDAYRSYRELRFTGLKKAGPGVDENLKERVSSIRNRVKKRIKYIGDTILSRSLEEHAADLKRVAPVMAALAELVARFGESYRRAKVARGLADFSDLEHYCLQVLTERDGSGELKPSPVAVELREQFEEVLVDEYQDINPVQEAIIKIVARSGDREPNLFMVGDVKQSIYRFRLADPTLFLEKYRRFSTLEGSTDRRINLSRNFRSRREIIDAVNFIFRRIMTREAAELDYDREAELVFGAAMFGEAGDDSRERRVELHLIDRSKDPEGGPVPENGGEGAEKGGEAFEEDAFGEEEELGPAQAEARLAAWRIKELIDGGLGVYDRSLEALRPVMYRDIVILMRATRVRAAIFMDELKRLGIPAYAEQDSGYFQSTEIETMVSLLKLVDNPRQDIPLAAVLRSPVVGLGCADLAVVRMARKSGDLWDALNVAAGTAAGDPAGRLSGFIDLLNRWRELGRRATMTELIWTIYRETGYYHYAGAMPGGAQRQANLRALHQWAGQFEATTFRGVFSFLRFIDRMREKGEDPGRALTLGEGENVVRIMSIHKSKGLEFPVVVLSGLGSRFNRWDLNSEVLLHRELGLGPWLVDPSARVAYPTLARLAVRERLRRESLAEEMRILYVAMTRAREKLILTGAAINLQRSLARWSMNVNSGAPASEVLDASSYLDWICPALAGHADGGPLRPAEADGVTPVISDECDNSRWLVNIAQLPGPGETPGGRQVAQPGDVDAERIKTGEMVGGGGMFAEEVHRRLSWAYPDRGVSGKPAKVSVTGLKEAASPAPAAVYEEEGYTGPSLEKSRQNLWFLKPAFARPAFMAARRELTAAERGSAIHMVMRHLDFGGGLDASGVSEQVARMAERDLITGEQAAVVDCGKIAQFFLSDPGRRVLAARSVKREVPFSLVVPAEDLYPGLKDRPGGEKVLVQGVIDCLAEEDDGYVLVDYKTDRLNGEDPGLAEKYGYQLEMYARAVETLTGRPVKDRYLYFFDSGTHLRV